MRPRVSASHLLTAKMSCNRVTISKCALVAFACLLASAFVIRFVPQLAAQDWDESNVGKRVRIRISQDRQWLGRETLNDVERCWEFTNAAAGGKLPNRVLLVVHWQDALSGIDVDRATVTVGMKDPASLADPKGFLLHAVAREFGRMALISLGGGSVREDSRFLLEGMSEMLAHDFSNTVKRLSAAWAITYYLDRMQPLGIRQLSSRNELAGTLHDLRSASPGITFLSVCRELYGRDKVLRLFESLGKRSLDESLAAAFRTPAARVESQWLERVRSYKPADITVASGEQAPVLNRISFSPEPCRPGARLSMRLVVSDKDDDLSASGIYGVDESSGRVAQGLQITESGERPFRIEFPIEAERPDGRYKLFVVAVDEGGNIRNWEAFYSVSR